MTLCKVTRLTFTTLKVLESSSFTDSSVYVQYKNVFTDKRKHLSLQLLKHLLVLNS